MTTPQTNPPPGSIHSLAGHVALITGGGSGIGLGIARAYVDAGAKVVLIGRREGPLQEACGLLGDAATWRALDLQNLAGIPALVDDVKQAGTPPTLLVHAAGIHRKASLSNTSDADLAEMWQVHVAAGFALARAMHGTMCGANGSILWIASMAALIGLPHVSAYSAAKSAVTGLVRGLADELAASGIRVNAIAPGWIDTPLLRAALDRDPARRDRILQRTPLGRFGSVEEVGHVAAFLASPAASFITGTVLPVDGGAAVGF